MTNSRWHQRIVRLERRWRKSPTCPECGYPTVVLRYAILVTDDEPNQECPVCGRPLASDATPLAAIVKRIMLWPEGNDDLLVDSP